MTHASSPAARRRDLALARKHIDGMEKPVLRRRPAAAWRWLRTVRWLLKAAMPTCFSVHPDRAVLPTEPIVERPPQQEWSFGAYDAWLLQYGSPSPAACAAIRAHGATLASAPTIYLVLPIATPARMRAQIASIEAQLYPRWRLGRTIEPGACDVVMLLAPGAILAPATLYHVAVEFDRHPRAELVYGDDDVMGADGVRHSPFFKPAWNIDLAAVQDLAGGFCAFRTHLLGRIGDAPRGFPDFAFHAALAATQQNIRHIPVVLSHIEAPRVSPVSGTGIALAPMPSPLPRVSVIVPTRDRADLLDRCATGLLERTAYANLEVIFADNGSVEPDAIELMERLAADPRVTVLRIPGQFNYSAINNQAAATASGEVLVLLNNDTEVIGQDWLLQMVRHAMRPDVGAVGARLLSGEGRIQHAGVVLGVGSFKGGAGVAGHFGLDSVQSDSGYFEQFTLTREVSAVTGACLAVRADVFGSAGGLDAVNLPVALNDIDLCLRIRAAGLRILYVPDAELYHLESASRGSDALTENKERFEREQQYMRWRWGPVLDDDPFYNPNFSRFDHSFLLGHPPQRAEPWRYFENQQDNAAIRVPGPTDFFGNIVLQR